MNGGCWGCGGPHFQVDCPLGKSATPTASAWQSWYPGRPVLPPNKQVWNSWLPKGKGKFGKGGKGSKGSKGGKGIGVVDPSQFSTLGAMNWGGFLNALTPMMESVNASDKFGEKSVKFLQRPPDGDHGSQWRRVGRVPERTKQHRREHGCTKVCSNLFHRCYPGCTHYTQAHNAALAPLSTSASVFRGRASSSPIKFANSLMRSNRTILTTMTIQRRMQKALEKLISWNSS